MPMLSASAGLDVAARPNVQAGRQRSPLYMGLALLMTAIVVVGFWPSYFGPALRGNFARPWVIQVHGIVYVGWMVLLLAQVGLVVTGRTRTHRALGEFGIWYGFAVLAMGLVVSVAAPVLHIRTGEWTLDRGAQFLVIPLGDMVLFGTFFVAAVAYRRQPQLHKRFIVLATTALLFAAVGRMDSLFPIPLLIALWVTPVLFALGHEAITHHRLDRVYFGGLVVLLIGAARLLLQSWEPWLAVARWTLQRLL